MSHKDITLLSIDHPGAHDQVYRKRRDFIARLAKKYRREGGRVPALTYTAGEQETWRTVATRLESAHKKHASKIYLAGKKKLGLSPGHLPQLSEINRALKPLTGFRMEPVEGLVDSRDFLSMLGKRIMLCTQYVRHHSRPEYTPEPDVIHELIGHAPMLANKDFANLSERIGKAAIRATARQIDMLDRLYWFTAEFGLIREGRALKAIGTGLFSSFGELAHAFSKEVERKPFKLNVVIATPYDYSSMQQKLFVISSFGRLKQDVVAFLVAQGL